jgi:hypothetical protein
MTIKILATALVVCGTAYQAQAATFTDRTLFESAVASPTVEDFENETVSGTPSTGGVASLTFSDFTVNATLTAAKLVNFPNFGADNTTSGGSKYLLIDSDLPTSYPTIEFVFSTAIKAFGFSYTDFTKGDFTFSAAGEIITVAKNVGFPSKFFGFTSNSLFTTLTITPFEDSNVGIDDVTYGDLSSVPTPASLPLLVAGLVGLGFMARRKRKSA